MTKDKQKELRLAKKRGDRNEARRLKRKTLKAEQNKRKLLSQKMKKQGFTIMQGGRNVTDEFLKQQLARTDVAGKKTFTTKIPMPEGTIVPEQGSAISEKNFEEALERKKNESN